MKLVFEITTVPPELYYIGEGRSFSESMIVDVPDKYVPSELREVIEGKEWTNVTHITLLKEAK